MVKGYLFFVPIKLSFSAWHLKYITHIILKREHLFCTDPSVDYKQFIIWFLRFDKNRFLTVVLNSLCNERYIPFYLNIIATLTYIFILFFLISDYAECRRDDLSSRWRRPETSHRRSWLPLRQCHHEQCRFHRRITSLVRVQTLPARTAISILWTKVSTERHFEMNLMM